MGGRILTTPGSGHVWWYCHYEDHMVLPQHYASYLLWQWRLMCHVDKSGLHGLSSINKRPLSPPKKLLPPNDCNIYMDL